MNEAGSYIFNSHSMKIMTKLKKGAFGIVRRLMFLQDSNGCRLTWLYGGDGGVTIDSQRKTEVLFIIMDLITMRKSIACIIETVIARMKRRRVETSRTLTDAAITFDRDRKCTMMVKIMIMPTNIILLIILSIPFLLVIISLLITVIIAHLLSCEKVMCYHWESGS